MDAKVASIINYCSNDYPFLKESLLQARKFSKQVIVVVADHLFNGQKEDLEAFERIFLEFDFATFIIYPFIPEKIPQRILQKVRKANLWHCISRYIGKFFLEKDISHVLFLDVDEIVDGDKCIAWLRQKEYLNYDVLRLANYWYFASTSTQSVHWEDSVVLVKAKKVKNKCLLDSRERDAIFEMVEGKKKRMVLGQDSLPFIHHYSWVKTKKQMLTKVAAWGHKNDKDWKSLVEEHFENPRVDKDFVHGYKLIEVNPFMTIKEEETDQTSEKVNFTTNQLICDQKIKDFSKNKRDKENSHLTLKNIQRRKNRIYLSEKYLLKAIMKRSFKDYIYCQLERIKFKKPNLFF